MRAADKDMCVTLRSTRCRGSTGRKLLFFTPRFNGNVTNERMSYANGDWSEQSGAVCKALRYRTSSPHRAGAQTARRAATAGVADELNDLGIMG